MYVGITQPYRVDQTNIQCVERHNLPSATILWRVCIEKIMNMSLKHWIRRFCPLVIIWSSMQLSHRACLVFYFLIGPSATFSKRSTLTCNCCDQSSYDDEHTKESFILSQDFTLKYYEVLITNAKPLFMIPCSWVQYIRCLHANTKDYWLTVKLEDITLGVLYQGGWTAVSK